MARGLGASFRPFLGGSRLVVVVGRMKADGLGDILAVGHGT